GPGRSSRLEGGLDLAVGGLPGPGPQGQEPPKQANDDRADAQILDDRKRTERGIGDLARPRGIEQDDDGPDERSHGDRKSPPAEIELSPLLRPPAQPAPEH